jgi:hypothetical protein
VATKVLRLDDKANPAREVLNEMLIMRKSAALLVPGHGFRVLSLDTDGHGKEYPDFVLPPDLVQPNTGYAVVELKEMHGSMSGLITAIVNLSEEHYKQLMVGHTCSSYAHVAHAPTFS